MPGLFLKTMVRRDLFRATVAATAVVATGTIGSDAPATESSRSADKGSDRHHYREHRHQAATGGEARLKPGLGVGRAGYVKLSTKTEGNMRKLFATKLFAIDLLATAAVMLLMASPVAVAQTGSGETSGTANQNRRNPEAPIGHRQPRADQIPSEKNAIDPGDDLLSKENAALDRKIKGICRGC